jgi:ABC-2 type transport system ATP-binding protein
MIKVRNLHKKYGSKEILTGLDMDFQEGGVYGIMGANGAGKTTLFKCISGLEKYDGEIHSEWQPLKNQLGLLWTVPYMFSKITGREYIRLLCNARAITAIDIDEKNIFELPLDRFASQYSTGMKKKLALTAILLQQNQVFILDEPFNGVDLQSNMIIEEIILELKSLGKTVLISSHIFKTLSAVCDEIFVLNDGKVKHHVANSEFSKLEAIFNDVSVSDKIIKLDLR